MENETGEDIPIMDRQKEKEEVKPFRKYQLIVIALVFMLIIICYNILGLNKELENSNSEFIQIIKEFYKILYDLSSIKEEFNQIELNYVTLYEMDKGLSIDIIRTEEELNNITEAVDPERYVGFSLCYKASSMGDNPKTFRENCGGISPLLVLIETTNGYRFAGYTSVPFDREGKEKRFIKDNSAFIYSFNTNKKYNVVINEKAVGDFAGSFPQFGEADIFLANDGFLNNTHSKINFPKSYQGEVKDYGDNILNGGIKKFKVKEVEVLVCYIEQ